MVLMVGLILCALGCQTVNHIQFIVPADRERDLIGALRVIAGGHQMSDKTLESHAPRTLVYFLKGDLSYTYLGARRHNDEVIVDLAFRSAGVGGDDFKKLQPEIEQALRKLYGDSVRVIRDRAKMILVLAKRPNEAPATTIAVTPRATSRIFEMKPQTPSRHAARGAPATVMAHL